MSALISIENWFITEGLVCHFVCPGCHIHLTTNKLQYRVRSIVMASGNLCFHSASSFRRIFEVEVPQHPCKLELMGWYPLAENLFFREIERLRSIPCREYTFPDVSGL